MRFVARSPIIARNAFAARRPAPRRSLHMMQQQLEYLEAERAQQIDVELMSTHAFSLDQLMELAGLSCASAALDAFPSAKKALVVCGPGNNGGDGLVAARHLKHFGMEPVICYPIEAKKEIYKRLLVQCEDLAIPVCSSMPALDSFDVVLDAIFGFGFSGVVRAPFDSIVSALKRSQTPLLSIDVPTGWHVEQGNVDAQGLEPQVLISLTAPKLCAKTFSGRHYLGGRFVPPALAEKYRLHLPTYTGSNQFLLLSRSSL